MTVVTDARAAQSLGDRVLLGEVSAVARAISWAERGDERFGVVLDAIHPKTGRARVTGLTGAPGAGKSTLTAALAKEARATGVRVAILAVDPTSPFSGGALLGDRVRMHELEGDDGVLIRSMATRGATGGLARAAADAVDVLDAAGYGEIFVETVGVGQDEVDVFRLAETCVVVLTPGMGDDVQAIKAGLMEIADVFVVNKADREGADRTVREVREMLSLGDTPAFEPRIVSTIARDGTGVPELFSAILEHRAFLDGPEGAPRRGIRVKERVAAILKERLLAKLGALSDERDDVASLLARVAARELSPRAAAELLAAHRAAPASGIVKIAHLGVAVASVEKGGGFYDLLGLLETHREEVASQKVLTSFRPVGESFFELLEPTSPESAIAKFLEKRGPGIHHVCLEVTDIHAALARLKAAGVKLVHETPFEGAHDCLVAFIHPASTGGILLELSQPHTGR